MKYRVICRDTKMLAQEFFHTIEEAHRWRSFQYDPFRFAIERQERIGARWREIIE